MGGGQGQLTLELRGEGLGGFQQSWLEAAPTHVGSDPTWGPPDRQVSQPGQLSPGLEPRSQGLGWGWVAG